MAQKEFKMVFGARDKGLTRFLGNATRKFNKFNRALIQSQKLAQVSNSRMAVLGRGMKDVGGKMQGIGRSITRNVTLPVAAGVAASVKAFATFEEGLINVSKTSNIEGTNLDKLGKDIRGMSKEMPFATDELLGIATAAGQLGVSAPKDILKITETVAKLGKTSDLSGESAAITLARILKVTGEEIGNVDKLGSAFTALGNNVEASESQIAAVAGEVARKSAPLFKLASKDVVALSATMASMGIQAEAGGTAVLDTFKILSDSIRSGKGSVLKSIEKLTGLSRKELKAKFKSDKFGVFVDFIEGLKKVSDRGAEMDEVFDDLTITNKRTIASMGSLVQGSKSLRKNIDITNKEYENATALNDEYAKQLVTLNSRFGILRNKVVDLGIALGQSLGPVLKGTVIPGLESMIEWAEKHPSITTFTVAIAGIAAVAGPVIFVLGSMVKLIGSLIIGFKVWGTLATLGVVPAMAGIAASAGSLVLALGLLSAGIILVTDGFGTADPKMQKIFDGPIAKALKFSLGIGAIPQAIKDAEKSLKAAEPILTNTWINPQKALSDFIKKSDSFKFVWESIKATLNGVSSVLGDIAGKVGNFLTFGDADGFQALKDGTNAKAKIPTLGRTGKSGRFGQAKGLRTQESLGIERKEFTNTNNARITVDFKNVIPGTDIAKDKADGPLELNVGFANVT